MAQFGDDYLFEEEKEVVEPAGGHKIVDEMAHSVCPNVLFFKAIKANIYLFAGRYRGCIAAALAQGQTAFINGFHAV